MNFLPTAFAYTTAGALRASEEPGTPLAARACGAELGMKQRTLVLDSGLDKLQTFLLEMIPGEELTVDRAAEISGLNRQTCAAVLAALTNAGLMLRLQNDVYIRSHLPPPEK